MPHYPDEIEYSDKYQDDSYEYRHVLLPKEVYKKMSRNKLLSENVRFYWFRNGEVSESNNPEAGSTTNSISQSPTSCCSEEPEEPIHKLDCHLLGSSPQLIHSCMPDYPISTSYCIHSHLLSYSALLAFLTNSPDNTEAKAFGVAWGKKVFKKDFQRISYPKQDKIAINTSEYWYV